MNPTQTFSCEVEEELGRRTVKMLTGSTVTAAAMMHYVRTKSFSISEEWPIFWIFLGITHCSVDFFFHFVTHDGETADIFDIDISIVGKFMKIHLAALRSPKRSIILRHRQDKIKFAKILDYWML